MNRGAAIFYLGNGPNNPLLPLLPLNKILRVLAVRKEES